MPGRLNNKVAIITGAGGGIGRESALLFASEGCKVLCADINDKAGQETTKEINKLFGADMAIFFHCDVSKAADQEAMVALCEQKFGKLNIMFNNAGIMHGKDDDAVATEENIWDLTMNINLKGVYLGCKYGIPAMRRAGSGSIINTASFVAVMGAATPQIAYTASKGGVLAMSRELAIIHARENIRVNALCPGPLHTPLLMDFLNTDAKRNRRMVHLPMGRFGEAREQAYAALFLASDEASYITGTDFMVDGGLSAAYVTPEGETKSVPVPAVFN